MAVHHKIPMVIVTPKEFLYVHVAGNIHFLSANRHVAGDQLAQNNQPCSDVNIVIINIPVNRKGTFHEDHENMRGAMAHRIGQRAIKFRALCFVFKYTILFITFVYPAVVG